MTNNPELIERAWIAYAATSDMADAPEGVFIAVRRAFYGGAAALLISLQRIAEQAAESGEDDAQSVLDAMGAELQTFAEDVLAGKK